MGREPAVRDQWWLVVAAGVAVFMAQLDGTVVTLAVPVIERDLGTTTSLTEWVVLGYVLPAIALTLPVGRWLDGIGRRAGLVFGVAGFTAAGVAVGLAPGIWWLIAARAVQGSFGAVLFALVPTLATVAVRPGRRGRAMSVIMILGPLGAVSGPALGGVIIEAAGWPWLFYLNVPVGLLVIAIGSAQLPPGGGLRRPERAWLVETCLLGAAAAVLMLSLSLSAGHGVAWLGLAPAAVPFVLAWSRSSAATPVRDLLRTPGLPGPHLALLAEMAAVMAVQFLIPFFLLRAGASPTQVGVAMLAFPVAVISSGVAGGVLADAWDARLVTVAGTALVTAAVLLLLPLSPGWGPYDVAWRLAVAGAGAGLFAGPNQAIAMARAPHRLLTTTGATTSLVRQLGVALGPALATASWAASGYRQSGMRPALAVAAVLACLSVAAAAAPPGRRRAAPGPGPVPAGCTSEPIEKGHRT